MDHLTPVEVTTFKASTSWVEHKVLLDRAWSGPTADEGGSEFVQGFHLFRHVSEYWFANHWIESNLTKNWVSELAHNII